MSGKKKSQYHAEVWAMFQLATGRGKNNTLCLVCSPEQASALHYPFVREIEWIEVRGERRLKIVVGLAGKLADGTAWTPYLFRRGEPEGSPQYDDRLAKIKIPRGTYPFLQPFRFCQPVKADLTDYGNGDLYMEFAEKDIRPLKEKAGAEPKRRLGETLALPALETFETPEEKAVPEEAPIDWTYVESTVTALPAYVAMEEIRRCRDLLNAEVLNGNVRLVLDTDSGELDVRLA